MWQQPKQNGGNVHSGFNEAAINHGFCFTAQTAVWSRLWYGWNKEIMHAMGLV